MRGLGLWLLSTLLLLFFIVFFICYYDAVWLLLLLLVLLWLIFRFRLFWLLSVRVFRLVFLASVCVFVCMVVLVIVSFSLSLFVVGVVMFLGLWGWRQVVNMVYYANFLGIVIVMCYVLLFVRNVFYVRRGSWLGVGSSRRLVLSLELNMICE